MEPLKEMFNRNFYKQFGEVVSGVDKNFNSAAFVKDATLNLENLELNGPPAKYFACIKKHLPNDYKRALDILIKATPSVAGAGTGHW